MNLSWVAKLQMVPAATPNTTEAAVDGDSGELDETKYLELTYEHQQIQIQE